MSNVQASPEEDWDAEFEEAASIPGFKLNLETISKACGWSRNEEHKKLKEFTEEISGWSRSAVHNGHINSGDHCATGQTEEKTPVIVPYKIFVGNLSYRVTKKQVIQFFSKFGKVENIHFITDHKSRRRKGSAFIKFSSQDAVEKAVRATEEQLFYDGRQLRVFRANEKKRVLESRNTPYNIQSKLSGEEDIHEVEKREESIEQDESTHSNVNTKLQDLDDDTLLIVFAQLPLRDRVRIERVCIRWRYLALKTWQSLVTLDFKHVFQRFGEGLTDKILMTLLKKGCPNLRYLDISSSPYNMTDWALDIIGDNCPRLTHLDLSGVPCTSASLRNLSQKCLQLQRVKLQKCHGVGEKGLWWLFHQCKKLTFVDLEGNKVLTGQCFHMMGDQIKCLVLNGCSKLIDVGLEKLDRCPKLQELQLNDCISLTDKGLQNIAEFCSSLTTLKLGGLFGKTSPTGLAVVGRLEKLVDLNLSNNTMVTDTVLNAICRGCKQLRKVNISRCYQNLTTVGLDILASLPCLETLIISYLPQVSDATVKLLALSGTLKTVEARACASITNQGLVFLVENCCKLKHLDISGNFQISDQFLEEVLRSCDRGHSSHSSSLEIVLGGTSVGNYSTRQLEKASISVMQQDFSDIHMRPDRDLYFNLGSDDEYIDESTIEMDKPFGVDSFVENYLYEDDPLMEEEWDMS
ncbi:putative RNA-binding protein EEED8.10 [Lingula anatina]|uniref:RNA-binding protein EEED8.10 n=1 Tax=Lingula anatina TaxID=7574 RepID=A0A1S3H0J4_LINAN|nr:putative RNA-binding protein EEED8.10 [Lingula anatina]XP_013379643.1 putative RNA-binding protein EEED8.10 [Lingula anatina]XP_013379644.1 putative RNA-binding protein EEED8.10 [Lingula anatina]XP_013379645.1 putative RNA-binding protein EEED8.10 [Lingula anatina]|eukprot:XP_013379642.1 putative RNA-binding protein EEED8.10 [Lingula anatina]